jgi:arylsulfatase
MPRPNVLLICVDHWPGSLLGVAGHPKILTPTLDQMAASGVLYANAYSAAPVCIPARRTLMTGTSAKTHGDRVYRSKLEMFPHLKTMPQAFRDAGYQAYAVGKMHVYPPRSRIGFDDIILNEEGRHETGLRKDDFELFLEREGYPGQEFTHGMGNNHYDVRPWHLPEHCHPTAWTTREMCRVIQRRDPTRPGFWYCSYMAPHPPITPLRDYLDLYRDIGIDEPHCADWAKDPDLPFGLSSRMGKMLKPDEIALARMGFYAQCTYIDHQIRLLIGTLREEGLLEDTALMFTSDHGDMLGNHRLWQKRFMYDDSARVPLILMPPADYAKAGHHQVDHRIAELRDVMPTLLDICDIPIPSSVEGQSLVSTKPREYLYGEMGEGDSSTRMIRMGAHKLIWYPIGNRFQLFDLTKDPCEMHDLYQGVKDSDLVKNLTKLLIQNLYGDDLEWIKSGELVGAPNKPFTPKPDRSLSKQRGWR